jgi:hypothetical protein
MARWTEGEVVVRREVLGFGLDFADGDRPPWLLLPWAAIPVHVVEHDDDSLVAYIAPGAELGIAEGEWPTANGRHPWHDRREWQGHGVLMLHRRGDPYSVWHFWTGDDRAFAGWYVNLQAPYELTSIGFDTQDFELDLVISPDGSWRLKDDELLDQRVAEGRFRADHADWIRSIGHDLTQRLDQGDTPWSQRWTSWEPPQGWSPPRLTAGWQRL